MPDNTTESEIKQDQKSPEEMLVDYLQELDQRVMDLSQRVDVLEAEEKQPEMD